MALRWKEARGELDKWAAFSAAQEQAGGDRARLAEILDVSRQHVYKILKAYGLSDRRDTRGSVAQRDTRDGDKPRDSGSTVTPNIRPRSTYDSSAPRFGGAMGTASAAKPIPHRKSLGGPKRTSMILPIEDQKLRRRIAHQVFELTDEDPGHAQLESLILAYLVKSLGDPVRIAAALVRAGVSDEEQEEGGDR